MPAQIYWFSSTLFIYLLRQFQGHDPIANSSYLSENDNRVNLKAELEI